MNPIQISEIKIADQARGRSFTDYQPQGTPVGFAMLGRSMARALEVRRDALTIIQLMRKAKAKGGSPPGHPRGQTRGTTPPSNADDPHLPVAEIGMATDSNLRGAPRKSENTEALRQTKTTGRRARPGENPPLASATGQHA